MFTIKVSPQYQIRRGFSHGLALPAVVFDCELQINGPIPVKQLAAEAQHAFELTAEPCFTMPAARRTSKIYRSGGRVKVAQAEALMSLACGLAARFLRTAKLPVLESSAVDVRPADQPAAKAGGLRLRVFLPYVRSGASITAFALAVQALNCLAQNGSRPAGKRQLEVQLGRIQRALPLRLEGFQEPGQNRRYLIQAALNNAVPVSTVDNEFVTFGYGRHARRMNSTITDTTSPIGVAIAKNKATTARLLRRYGLPGAEHVAVTSEPQLIEEARRLGYPLVIKPADLDQGTGVFADIRSESVLLWAYKEAQKHSKAILLERHAEGDVYRITLYNGQPSTQVKKLPGGVVGDGVQTVSELLENGVPAVIAMGIEPGSAYQQPLRLDEEALSLLEQNSQSPQTVPAAGQFVPLKRKTNAFAGGITVPIDTDTVHPDNLALAKEVAFRCGLDLAGIDLIIKDISQSWQRSGALICEVNAQPQVGEEAAEKILLWHMGDEARIEVDVLLTETPEQLSAEHVYELCQQLGHSYLTTVAGLCRQGRMLGGPFASGFDAATAALQDTRASSLLCVLTPEELSRHGLPADRVRNVYTRHGAQQDPAGLQTLKTAFQAHVSGQWLSLRGTDLRTNKDRLRITTNE